MDEKISKLQDELNEATKEVTVCWVKYLRYKVATIAFP
jgi:hypothetical protein